MKRNLSKLGTAMMFFCTMLFGGGSAFAQLNAYDGFNYATGTLLTDSGGGSFGFTGAWTGSNNNVIAGDLTFAGLQTSGDMAESIGNNQGSFRTLSATYGGPNQTLWFSFLARVDPTSGEQPGGTYAGVSLFNASEQLFMGIPNAAANWGLQVDPPGNTPTITSSTPAGASTVFLVYELAYDGTSNVNVTMFIDPAPGAALPGAPAVTVLNQAAFTFNEIRIQSGSTLDVDFDELRLGQTYADVSPSAATPEPSGLVVAASFIGGIFGLGLRRGRRARRLAHS